MSSDATSKRTQIQRVALAIVRREMHEYDQLSRRSHFVIERHIVNALDIIEQEKLSHHEHGTRSCAHGHALHDTCGECCRTEEDTKAYRVAATQRLKDLLKQLGE